MHHAFYALTAHVDVAKFELEDGIIRVAGASILRHESSISRILVDVPMERRLVLDVPTVKPGWDAIVIISANMPPDCLREDLAPLVLDVATVGPPIMVSVVDVLDVPEPWIGSATPGPKVSLVLRRSAGVDMKSYDLWLHEAVEDCASRIDRGGCRAITPKRDDDRDARFDTIASFWFPTEEALTDALAAQALAPLTSSHLIDAATIGTMSSTEHRLTPNPNAWKMPDGPLMPVVEDVDE